MYYSEINTPFRTRPHTHVYTFIMWTFITISMASEYNPSQWRGRGRMFFTWHKHKQIIIISKLSDI